MKRWGWLPRFVVWFLSLTLLLVLVMGAAVSWGSAELGWGDVWRTAGTKLTGSEPVDPATEAIIWQIRFPRVILAAVVGMALAGAGVVFQGLLRNPLADPYILGVSSGAALGAAIAIFTGAGAAWLGGWTVPVWAFLLAAVALFLVLGLAGRGLNRSTLILSGVVIQAFFGAMLTFLIGISSAEELQRIQFWIMGSVAAREWHHIYVVLPFMIPGLTLIWLMARQLNLFSLGERSAAHLGVPVRRIRMVLLLSATLMTAAAVAVSGTIGFVGLIIPHIMRRIVGPDHRVLIPAAVLAGGLFLVGADTVARTVMEPRELPIGVVTALVGAPFFAWQLKRRHEYQ
ncbi:FecCD family ABC transporter permease [Kroppenstedtia eburnea]|uniref:Iron complex transport system permease protein n=1 Tax=Kroppenstedtia eburnea TaxID=714067 RepID=A0A1N7NK97_9BACL|nr:iron ABC transporter permease [Kroppenstedtia eburnea]QKI80989.1 iron ABC transporter permease [Kroppenstedtia eburnea]SIS98711.1 iron complex transport system permease protein [Kroppenstedtia eburnea]